MLSIVLLYLPGHWELIMIALAIILLFGGRKIPEMMRGLGTGVKEFRKGIKDDETTGKSLPDEEQKRDTEKK